MARPRVTGWLTRSSKGCWSGSRTPTRRTATRSPASTPAAAAATCSPSSASLLGAQPGESLRMEGRWGSHPQYGKQFTVENYTTVLPATIQGIRRYLGSGLVKGIGPVFADRIVAALRHGHPGDHRGGAEAPDRGARARPEAHQEDRRGLGGAEGDQGGHGLPPGRRGLHLHRRAHLQEVRRRLDLGRARTSRTGWPPTSGASASSPPTRSPRPSASRTTARSGSRPACSTPCRSPPTRATASCPRSELIADAVKLLQVDTGLVIECLAELAAPRTEGVVREKVPGPDGGEPVTAVYLVPFHRAETLPRRPAAAPAAHRGGPDAGASRTWTGTRRWPGSRSVRAPSWPPSRRQAVRLALTEKVAVLTGGPGCGKSLHRPLDRGAGPRQEGQGRARRAHRPGRQAARRADRRRGLHRAPAAGAASPAATRRTTGTARWTPTWWSSTRRRCSTCCWPTSWSRRSPPGAHLLLVGDVDQLPSRRRGRGAARPARRRRPGPGRPADPDLPAGPAVRRGHQRPPDQRRAATRSPQGLTDFFLFVRGRHGGGRGGSPWTWRPAASRPSSASTRAATSRSSPRCTAARRAPARSTALLQQAITPARPDLPEKRFGGRVFRVGDKVTQIRNNYDKGENGVFNGTVGVVTALDPDEQRLTVLHGRGRGGRRTTSTSWTSWPTRTR